MNVFSDKEEFIAELKNVVRMFIPFFNSELNITINSIYTQNAENAPKTENAKSAENAENKVKTGKIECIIGEKTYKISFKQEKLQNVRNGKKQCCESGKNDNSEKPDCGADDEIQNADEERALLKEYKIALYKSLKKYFNKKLPWGSLTGIRPTRIVYKQTEAGISLSKALKSLKKKYLVSGKKTALVNKIIQQQKGCLYNCNDYVNLYIHIPFCPSRCSYCSFVSLDINKSRNLLEPYLERLIEEIRLFKLASDKRILSVYIGGGTPTVLGAQQLSLLLEEIEALGVKNVEFTVEAGRPDTITAEKLAVLARFNVTRISINPQTFCENTLKTIGRNHTMDDILTAYNLSRKFKFGINMDLIAGLSGENAEDFVSSVKKAVELRPENITVHTLSIKNGSALFNDSHNNNSHSKSRNGLRSDLRNKSGADGFAKKMTDFAQKILLKAGYSPYYLYRQKNMADSLENIGYTLKGRQNVFNITSMEETVSVLAFGAGAITKIVTPLSIERFAALRDVRLYIDDFDKMCAKKSEFLNSFNLK